MRFLHRLLRPGPPEPPGNGPGDQAEPDPSRIAKRRSSARRPDEIRDLLPSELVAAGDAIGQTSAQELLDFLRIENPTLARELESELARGQGQRHNNLGGAVRRVALQTASRALNGRCSMEQLAADGRLAVALPVPPHIEDWALEAVEPKLIFAAEDHLPPHLEEADPALFLRCQAAEHLAQMLPELNVQGLPAAFRNEHHIVFALPLGMA